MVEPDDAAIGKTWNHRSFSSEETTKPGLGHLFSAERKETLLVTGIIGVGASVKPSSYRPGAQTADIYPIWPQFFMKRVRQTAEKGFTGGVVGKIRYRHKTCHRRHIEDKTSSPLSHVLTEERAEFTGSIHIEPAHLSQRAGSMSHMMTYGPESRAVDEHFNTQVVLQAESVDGIGGSLLRQIDGQREASTLRLLAQGNQRLLRPSTASDSITHLRKLARYLSADPGRGPRY